MRISYLHGSGDLYGASQMLLQEVTAATGLGHDVSVVLPHEGPLVGHLERAGVPVVVDSGLRVLRAVDPLSAVRRKGADLPRSDVVVLWTLALLGEARNARRSGARVGVSVHELLVSRPGRLLRRYLASLDAPVQYNSQAVRRWLQQGGVTAERLHRIYPVVPTQDPVPRRTQAPSIHSPFTMLLMGRINGAKGHADVAREFGRLGRADARLLLAGAPFPGQERHLTNLVEVTKDLPEVELLGQVHDLRPLAEEVDLVLTLPSRPEALGLQPIEFWAMGVRSAGWSWGGQAEVLRLVDGVALPHAPGHIGAWLTVLLDRWTRTSAAPDPGAVVSSLCTGDRRDKAVAEFLSSCLTCARP